MNLGKFSFGIGDRFGRQGKAQLAALIKAQEEGLDITPVWNKSHREHSTIGTHPGDVRREADEAVAACGWKGAYFVDADHISLSNVDVFVEAGDFFTLDVANFIGCTAPAAEVDAFAHRHRDLLGSLRIDGIENTFEVGTSQWKAIASKYLAAVREAGKVYRHIAAAKGADAFITEVSMDETDAPQTPVELLIVLAAIADEGIPVQTVAPKFSGRFNKGVDYVGDPAEFAREFEQDVAVIAFAVQQFGLPTDLKLSVHSGSDKFSIYGPINQTLKRSGAGVHVKTAGTTWLEELIGLALAGGDGLELAQEIYTRALARMDELCGPYAAVIDIDRRALPCAEEVESWSSAQFVATLRHDPRCSDYNPNVRQLLHVAYKIAAQTGSRFFDALDRYESIIAEQVATNIYERHLRPIFA